MQRNLKRTITVIAGVASIAAVALLAMYFMQRASTTQPAEMSQQLSEVTAATANPTESQAITREAVAVHKPDAPRDARRKHAHRRSAALESGGVSLAFGPAPLDDNVAVGLIPSFAATVDEVTNSFMLPSETGESSDDLSVFSSSTVPSEIHVSTYVTALPAATEESYVSTYLSGRASTLLAEIRAEGTGLRLNAETLGTFARNFQYSWQSHAFYLERVKEHINAVGERLAELQQILHAVLPWQQQATTEITSHAAQVAASTQAAIVHLRENENRLFVPEYRDCLKTIAIRSEGMKQTVDKYLEYEKAQQKFQQLQDELEL